MTDKITIDRAVVKQALEALEVSTDWDLSATGKQGQSVRAITALRSALSDSVEQPQQEPDVVEFRQFLTDVHTAAGLIAHGKQSKALSERLAEAVVKYRTQKQEPVAWMMVNPTHLPSSRSLHWEPQDWHITWQAVPLYTHPAPRTEQPRLTDEEIQDAVREADLDWHQGWTLDEQALNRYETLCRAIEARILGGKT